MVHRPKYDDWSWAKGKLDPGEEYPVAASRETAEETGLDVHLGMPLPPASYTVLDRTGVPATKQVRYWAAEVVGGEGRLVNEIDEVAWLDVLTAHDKLDYARDRDQLRAVVRADAAGRLTTWPLAVVRHAKARPRGSWTRPDPERPLDERGEVQAQSMVPLLAAYGVTIDPNAMVLSNGVHPAIIAVLKTFAPKGSKVLLQTPTYIGRSSGGAPGPSRSGRC